MSKRMLINVGMTVAPIPGPNTGHKVSSLFLGRGSDPDLGKAAVLHRHESCDMRSGPAGMFFDFTGSMAELPKILSSKKTLSGYKHEKLIYMRFGDSQRKVHSFRASFRKQVAIANNKKK